MGRVHLCRRGFSRERVISNEHRKARYELVQLNRGGCLMLLNRFAFSALKRLLRVSCASFVGRAIVVNFKRQVAAQTRHASITPTV